MHDHPRVLNEILEQLGRYTHVEKVLLFGSRARGDAHDRSDIDLAVLGTEITDREWTEIWDLIDQAPTLLSIDAVRWEEASEKIRASIESEGVVLYERQPAPPNDG